MCSYMDQTKLREFTERFLISQQCQIVESTPNYLITQLSVEADKELLNRPFYWLYVEKMGLTPQPTQLCFLFDKENPAPDLRGEYLHFGAPRFKMMLQAAKKRGRFVRLYQLTHMRPRTHSLPYVPWLAINFKVSYISDQKKECIHHLGINLQTGEIREHFYQELCQLNWTNKLPTGRHLLPEKMSLIEAISELEYYIEDLLKQEDHTWAKKAYERYVQEVKQLESYFPEEEKRSPEEEKYKESRMQEIIRQHLPRIEIEVINAGYFYKDVEISKWMQQKISQK